MHASKESLPFVALLKACAKNKDLRKGTRVHADILETNLLGRCPFVGSSLVNMYAKCGALGKSQEVFDELPARNTVCWNALIAGYAQEGFSERALVLFEQMQENGYSPDAITYICTLKACGSTGNVEKGKQIHEEIVKSGMLQTNNMVGNALVDMYAKCGVLELAEKLFYELPVRKVVGWNALIAGYAQNGHGEKAVKCFYRMKNEGFSPDSVTYICVLKSCAIIKAVDDGQQIHDEIVHNGLFGKDIVLDTALVNMYAKSGALVKARQVFEEIPKWNVVCWNTLLAGYAKHGQNDEALEIFDRMQKDGFSPNAVTYICTLKACSRSGAICKGERIHDAINRDGLLKKNISLGTALLDMYAKCGALRKAEQVFDELPIRKVVSWNALIAGYVQQGQGEQALICFERMRKEGTSPNSVTYITVLKACAGIGNVHKGKEIHEKIVRDGYLAQDIMLGTALVDMYAKGGELEKARQMFDELPVRNAVCWNAIIAGYASQGQGEEAMHLFVQMQKEGFSPDEVTYICALKACSCTGMFDKGKQIHDEIVRKSLLGRNISLATSLVDMYAKCGALDLAEQVFDKFAIRNVVFWNALIAGYAREELGDKALSCFQRMQKEGLSPNAITFICILKACSSVGALDTGKEIHGKVVRDGLLRKDIALGAALVDMYAKCGALEYAKQVFDELPVRNLVCWNTMIAGYTQQGHGEETLKLCQRMEKEGFTPDAVTYICILKACAITGALDKGISVHAEIIKRRLLDCNISLATALLDMYTKCDELERARQVFDELPVRNVVCWNVLIAGYAQQGHGEDALNCFEQMQSQCCSPDPTTFSHVLRVCASTRAVEKGKQIHEQISREKLLEKHFALGAVLIDMYAKFGDMEGAQLVFDSLAVHDLPCWTTLIAGYVQQEKGEEALNCFERMKRAGFSPDSFVLSSILKACASTGAIFQGQKIHDEIIRNKLLENDVVLGTALLDMYAKCGVMEKSERVFSELPVRTLVCWNAVIAGYAQQGLATETLKSFGQMQEEGFSPDSSTFICVLNACSHSGLIDEGEKHFMDMRVLYGLTPGLDHYTCMVDLFSRAGHFEKAVAVIEKLPCDGNLPLWLALLAACRNWGNVRVGMLAFEQASQFDSCSSASHLLMINTCLSAGIQDEAE